MKVTNISFYYTTCNSGYVHFSDGVRVGFAPSTVDKWVYDFFQDQDPFGQWATTEHIRIARDALQEFHGKVNVR